MERERESMTDANSARQGMMSTRASAWLTVIVLIAAVLVGLGMFWREHRHPLTRPAVPPSAPGH